MKIALLVGPSSVGKSTIMNELKSIYGWRTFDADVIIPKKTEEYLKEYKSLPPLPDTYKMLYDEVFAEKNKFGVDDVIVLDMVPAEKILAVFNTYVSQYNKNHTENPATIHNVLLYSTPQILSARVSGRNQKAESNKNQEDKRIGSFPIHQLANLFTVDPKAEVKESYGTLSKKDIFKIAYQHPEPSPQHTLTTSTTTTSPALCRWKKLRATSISSLQLAKHFGFFKEKDLKVTAETAMPLVLRKELGLKFDLTVDASTSDASSLAKHLVAKIAPVPTGPSFCGI
jgi:hypothetical protein